MKKDWAQRIRASATKNPYLLLVGTILGGLILLGAAIEAAERIWNTRKLFNQATEDTDAIAELRSGLEKQNAALDVLVRDSNTAYKEIAAVREIAGGAKEEIQTLDGLVKEGQVAVVEIKGQLEQIRLRNEILSLADKAISDGDKRAYLTLEQLASPDIEKRVRDVAIAEIIRIYGTHSPTAPTRVHSRTIKASLLNPKKNSESELDADDILPFLTKADDPLARAKLAFLLSRTTKRDSFKCAEAIVEAIRTELHLEVIRYLRLAFARTVSGYDGEKGKIDGRDILEWWDTHKDEARAKDTDKPPLIGSP